MGKSQNSSNFQHKKLKIKSLTDIPAHPSPVPIAGPGPGAESGDEDCDGGVMVRVECGPNVALLSLTRLQQGSRGACVRFDSSWITPNQFQLVSGRETAKDWKRSIKHHGKSLKVLLANDIMIVQPPVCLCEECTGHPPPLPKKSPKVKKSPGTVAATPSTGPSPPVDEGTRVCASPMTITPQEKTSEHTERREDPDRGPYRAPGLYRMAMPLSPSQAAIRANILKLMEKKSSGKRKDSDLDDYEDDGEEEKIKKRRKRKKKLGCVETMTPFRGDVFEFHDDAGDESETFGELAREFSVDPTTGSRKEFKILPNHVIHTVNSPALLPVANLTHDLGGAHDHESAAVRNAVDCSNATARAVDLTKSSATESQKVPTDDPPRFDLEECQVPVNDYGEESEGGVEDEELAGLESEDWRLAEDAFIVDDSDDEEPGQITVLNVTTPITLPVTKLNSASPKSFGKAWRLSSIIDGLHQNRRLAESSCTDKHGHHGDTQEMNSSGSSRERLRQILQTEKKSASMETQNSPSVADGLKTESLDSTPSRSARSNGFPASDGRGIWRTGNAITAPKVATVPPITRAITVPTSSSSCQPSPCKKSAESQGPEVALEGQMPAKLAFDMSKAAGNLTWYLPYYASLGLANMMMVPYLSSQMMSINADALSKLTGASTNDVINSSVGPLNTTDVMTGTSVNAVSSSCSPSKPPTDRHSSASPNPIDIISSPNTSQSPETPLDLSLNTPTNTTQPSINIPMASTLQPPPILDLSSNHTHTVTPPRRVLPKTTPSQPQPLRSVREAVPGIGRRKSPAFPGSEGILNPALGALSKWSTDDVTKFVSSVEGCQDYIKNFQAFGVCGKSLPFLSLDHMRELLCMKPSAAVSLRSAIDRLLLLPDSVLSTYV